MRPLSTASSVSLTATTAPAGSTSKDTVLLVSAATSAANSFSIVTSSALVGITDCTRILTVFGAWASAMPEATSVAAAKATAEKLQRLLFIVSLLLSLPRRREPGFVVLRELLVFLQVPHGLGQRIAPERVAQLLGDHHLDDRGPAVGLALHRLLQRGADV